MASVAAAPLASRLDASPKPHIKVIGAGAFGGWTALHLLERGARVTLVDAWGPGNSRASSGGESRVIRAIYGPETRQNHPNKPGLYCFVLARDWNSAEFPNNHYNLEVQAADVHGNVASSTLPFRIRN